jgi:hypothetical protein
MNTTVINGRGRGRSVRLTALFACVLFAAAMLLSFAYILTHANHTHDHDGPCGDCAACMCIQAAVNLLKTLSAAVAFAAIVFGGLCGLPCSIKAPAPNLGVYTLVSCHVRLNN